MRTKDKQMDKVQIEGSVISLNYNRDRTSTVLKVELYKGNKTVTVICNGYVKAQKSDSFSGICQTKDNGTFLSIVPPFIHPRAIKQAVVDCMFIALCKRGFYSSKAQTVYSRLYEIKRSEDGVCDMITEYATDFMKTRNPKPFGYYASPEMNEEHIKEFLKWWHLNYSLRKVYLLGLTPAEVQSVKRMDLSELYDKLISNPLSVYELEISKCQEVMSRYNVRATQRQLTLATIARYLHRQVVNNGWVGTPLKKFLESNSDLVSDESLLVDLVKDYGIKIYEGLVYLPYQVTVEDELTKRFKRLMDLNGLPSRNEGAIFHENNLIDEQKEAIRNALKYKLSVITGPAGTGKTTIIKEIVRNLALTQTPHAVLAFTGKAVSRIKEVIDSNIPSTIHRFIACGNIDEIKHFIFDEAGMIYNELMYEFLTRFPGDYSLTFVGDPNQLLPMGFGSFFSRMIESGKVPVSHLHMNHRTNKTIQGPDGQILEDGILENANRLISSELFEPKAFNNFMIIPNQGLGFIQDMVRVLLTEYQIDDITILSPYKSELEVVNEMVSDLVNYDSDYTCDSRARKFRIGDRVMMIANNYKINIMNGDEGHVIGLLPDTNQIKVRFLGNEVCDFNLEIPNKMDFDVIDEEKLHVGVLKHSFCKTVHKSQGSEYHCVILFIPERVNSSGRFLNKNLIYTAITRAKTAFYCVGDTCKFLEGCNTKPVYRYDNLHKRLQSVAQPYISQ